MHSSAPSLPATPTRDVGPWSRIARAAGFVVLALLAWLAWLGYRQPELILELASFRLC